MDHLQCDLELAVDNAYNFFKYSKSIPKLQADDLIDIHKKIQSSSFWNYIDSIGDHAFRTAVENILNQQYS